MIAKERLTRASADRLRSLRSLRVQLNRVPLARNVRVRNEQERENYEDAICQ